MFDVVLLKQLHITCAVLTATGFLLRGTWRLRGSPMLERRWVRVVPHTVDTLLFATGIAMLWQYGWWPFDVPWLGIKLVLVVVYILLGMVALRRGGPRGRRTAAWVAALAVLAYIFGLALGKRLVPFV